MGGLGNQIIQYIFGRYLQEKFKCDLIFDTSHFDVEYNIKSYPLMEFNIHLIVN